MIPPTLQTDILHRLHQGHQGVVKCRALARRCVWWPGLATQIEELVSKCDICEKERIYPPDPMKPTKTPDYPWQRVAMDLFELKGKQYLLIIDYYSRWIEIAYLQNTSSLSVIEHVKSIFAIYHIPEVVVSDNGPQFSSRDFLSFAKYYDFLHVTSSPHHPQGNGEAERAVRTVKDLLKKAEDPYLALLNYRAIPLQVCTSPAELLMLRKIRLRVPTLSQNLNALQQDVQQFKKHDGQLRSQQKMNFDQRHQARELPPVPDGLPVWSRPKNDEAVVVQSQAQTPRSVLIQTDHGLQRLNPHHLRHRSNATTPARALAQPRVTSTLPEPVMSEHPSDGSSPEEPHPGPDQPPVTAANREGATSPGRPPDLRRGPQLDQLQDTCTKSSRRVKAPQKLNL